MNIWPVANNLRKGKDFSVRVYKDDNSLFCLRVLVYCAREPHGDDVYLWRWVPHLDHYLQVPLPGRGNRHWGNRRWLQL